MLPVHLVHTPSLVTAPIFLTYATASDLSSTSHESSAERMTSKGNHTMCNNSPNPVLNVPADPDSDPGPSYSSSLDSSDSSYDKYSKRERTYEK